ncbi:uncharacterized protein AKAW2_50264S [Aspergillus luchuensis]|uniref:Uncharacterized protein n=1 Tax=Aspergillus kawachii TaxID=1069201 RepID=A0A7R7WBH7_ASPKA|nr:uncharacterized protein AKAW2_50264S [Aspergillus luchuensis]KAI2929026.1 hypothetical protein CBS147321_10901 [Aspergillus niger]BCR99922.1 hypothetical protein AKAW2_50264S [Aspergillus luchuensis]
MKTHLPRLNKLRKVLASAEKDFHSGTRSNASHYTESAPPDGRKANFQAVSGEGISTHENDASDRDAMSEVDSVVPNELPEHPNNVADTSTKALTMLICDLESRVRKLEEQVKGQSQENHRLHRRVSSIYESVPTSHTKSRRSARYKDMESE